MTNTEKRLKEFREKFLKQKICKTCLREACDYSTTGCPWYQETLTLNKDTKDWEDTGEQMLAFLSASIHQALAEDRERVRGIVNEKVKEYHKDCLTDMFINGKFWAYKEMQGYLDKPLTDK